MNRRLWVGLALAWMLGYLAHCLTPALPSLLISIASLAGIEILSRLFSEEES